MQETIEKISKVWHSFRGPAVLALGHPNGVRARESTCTRSAFYTRLGKYPGHLALPTFPLSPRQARLNWDKFRSLTFRAENYLNLQRAKSCHSYLDMLVLVLPPTTT
ncbi:uncharacterized protein CLUP02_12547 [Colletotrichum lupini]|uniref:Uncharacterized protein n=1 Tax=Colletotrichum lupini TaxID=145971 RepID=A0A9Q8T142_9PEZI|nr:uncharacterized protein CLUP02_12547 [Colletotrichum lupini]UQC87045.1 hypothetical protein CLUP02_12547 [Colletotrichum lupini]